MVKRILIIAPYPHNEAPSQRFRFEQYLEFLKEDGHVIDFSPFLGPNAWQTLYKEGNTLSKVFFLSISFLRRWGLMFTIWRYQKIFIHREASMIGPPIFEWIISKVWRKKYIYDFDDAVWLPNYSESNARFQKIKMYGKIPKIIKWAGQVSAGNAFLTNYAQQYNQHVVELPTTIDLDFVHNLHGNPNESVPVIGWTGSHTTMQYLESLLPVLDRISEKKGFIFRIISNQKPAFERSYVEFVKWHRETEIADLATFNIGIMPLTDSEWSRGKCGFKALQYMALGIPAVVSPVGVNIEIIEDKTNGFLCQTQDEWHDVLAQLLSDVNLRTSIGMAGKNTVHQKYSVTANREAFLKLFQ